MSPTPAAVATLRRISPCGCVLTVVWATQQADFLYCPLHAAAPTFHALLGTLLPRLVDEGLDGSADEVRDVLALTGRRA